MNLLLFIFAILLKTFPADLCFFTLNNQRGDSGRTLKKTKEKDDFVLVSNKDLHTGF